MKIILGNDHANIVFVEEIKKYLELKGFLVDHVGTYTNDSVDYPDFAEKVGKKVIEADNDTVKGIVICGTGLGISIAANKIKGVICANCCDISMAALAREHNNANILALGARTLSVDLAKDIIDIFFLTSFAGKRHEKRLEKIRKLED